MEDMSRNFDILNEHFGERPETVIKTLLLIKNISQRGLSKKHGLNVSDVSKVIAGKRKTRKIRQLIADELEIPVYKLFSQYR